MKVYRGRRIQLHLTLEPHHHCGPKVLRTTPATQIRDSAKDKQRDVTKSSGLCRGRSIAFQHTHRSASGTVMATWNQTPYGAVAVHGGNTSRCTAGARIYLMTVPRPSEFRSTAVFFNDAGV